MNKSLLGSAATYTGANLLSSLIPVLLIPVMTRILSPDDYGIVAIFNSAVAYLVVAVGLGVQGTIPIQYYRLPRPEVAQLVTACFLILGASFLVVSLATLGWWTAISKHSNISVSWMLTASAVAAMQFVYLLRLSVLQAEKRSFDYALLQIFQSLSIPVISIVLIVAWHLGWRGRILGAVIAYVILTVMAVIGLRRDCLLIGHTRGHHVRSALHYGVTVLPHVLGGLTIALSDQLLVGALLGTRAAGIFSVALSAASAIQLVTIALNRAWAPWLYENLPAMEYPEKLRVARYTYAYFILLAMGAAGYGAVLPFLLKFMVGQAFVSSGSMALTLSLGFGFGGMYFAVTNYVFHMGATARLALVTASSGVISIILTYAMLKIFGFAGAGYGFALSQLILFLNTWRLAQSVCPMPWAAALRSMGKRVKEA